MVDVAASIERFISSRLGYHLAVIGRDRPLPFRRGQPLQALDHDPDRLAHLLHADQIAVIAIAVLADRYVGGELVIAFIRLRLAEVPRRRQSPAP